MGNAHAESDDVDVDDRLLGLLGRIHGAVVEFDGDARYLNVWSEDPASLVAPREQLIGKTLCEVLGPALGDMLTERIQRVHRTGVAEKYQHGVKLHGRERWIAADLKRVRRGDRHTVILFRVDMTERKEAQEALRLSEERYRLAAEATNDLLYDADLTNRTVIWGHSIVRVFGHPVATSADEWVSFVHPEDRERLESKTMAAFGGIETSWLFSYRVRRGDGTYADVLDRATIFRNAEGQPERLVGSLADVTQLNRLQTQLVQADRLAALGMLAAGVGHEINNPLCFVLGNLDLAIDTRGFGRTDEERAEEADAKSALKDAREGAQRILEIVKSLRLFARSEPTVSSGVRIDEVIERAIKISENEIRHRARLVRVFADVPPVRVNESQLGQVCLNLVVNAAQAIPLGSAERNEITVTTGVDDGGRAFFSVRDTGGGIAPEHIDRVFDPFFTTKPVGVGTGIGLSVCMSIVQSMGGELTVASQPGNTVFTVSLPVESRPSMPGRSRNREDVAVPA